MIAYINDFSNERNKNPPNIFNYESLSKNELFALSQAMSLGKEEKVHKINIDLSLDKSRDEIISNR
jgi:hypothetical protein